MKTQSRKTIQNRLDKNWSIAVKMAANYTCQYCGRKKEELNGKKRLDSHHILARKYKVIKWDLSNGVCLCYKCHRFGAHGDDFVAQDRFHKYLRFEHTDWMLKKYGKTLGHLMTAVSNCKDPLKPLPIDEVRQIDEVFKLIVKGLK